MEPSVPQNQQNLQDEQESDKVHMQNPPGAASSADTISLEKNHPTTDYAPDNYPPKVEARKPSAPARPKGPNASAIVFGLVAIVLAGLVIAKETMDLRVDWSRLGPGGTIGIGVVMALIGAIGLIRRHDDA